VDLDQKTEKTLNGKPITHECSELFLTYLEGNIRPMNNSTAISDQYLKVLQIVSMKHKTDNVSVISAFMSITCDIYDFNK